jgi:hypothetical protein
MTPAKIGRLVDSVAEVRRLERIHAASSCRSRLSPTRRGSGRFWRIVLKNSTVEAKGDH